MIAPTACSYMYTREKKSFMPHWITATSLVSATALIAAGASATPLDDFNSGTIVADFLFNDSANTAIKNVVGSVNPTVQFDEDTDNEDVKTNGSGQLDASGKNNTDFGSNYVDLDAVTTGVVYGLFEVSWAFDEETYAVESDEEFRISLMRSDPRSTSVTAETTFIRTADDEVTLFGNGVGTGSSNTSSVVLGSSGSLLTILAADLDNDTLTLSYSSDGGSSFTTLTAGSLESTRDIESLRLVLNEDFSDDSLLIDRIAVSVVPEPTSFALITFVGLALLHRRRRD